MNLFFVNDNYSYGYNDLLQEINTNKSYYPLLKTSDIYLYFLNLIKALITSQPLVLLDSDLKSDEIGEINDNIINQNHIQTFLILMK